MTDTPGLADAAEIVADEPEIDRRYITAVPFVRHDAAGHITGQGTMGLGHLEDEARREGGIVQGAGAGETHYVDVVTGSLRAKTPCPARREGMVLSGLPVPCRIEIGQLGRVPTLYDWSDPALTLAFDHPGYWSVRVLALRHQDGRFDVQVDA